MGYGILALLLFGILGYWEISRLKAKAKLQQKQIDTVCEAVGLEQFSTRFLSKEERGNILALKQRGKEVEAVKKLRQLTTMDLLEAKQYIDRL